VSGVRRFSQAISEGDGISVIVEVDGPDAARRAAAEGAEAVLVLSGNERHLGEIREATQLPVIFWWDGEHAAAVTGADACIVEATGDDDRERLERIHADLGDDFEVALRISDDDHLESALEHFDPEIVVLCAPRLEGEEALEHVLDLLPDVPAGKLAVAEVAVGTREEVVALERAGIDAVIVGAGDVSALVGELPPDR
jgi:indole-3-glycerol phosphate synthase